MAVTGKLYIDGRWIAGGSSTFEQRNPADLEEVTGTWPAGNAADAERAIAAAKRAFPAWSALPPIRRADLFKSALALMDERRERIAEALTRENGKTLKESLSEVRSAYREMEYQISEGLRLYGMTAPSIREGVFTYSVRRPLGVVSVISPWNFPFNVPARKITPALMSGNTCVFKPASLTPLTGMLFVELFHDAGFPPGVINFVTGGGSEVGNALVTSPDIRAISFTGSTEVGRGIHRKASASMIRTQLEMGGKNPVVVLADADVEDAVKAIMTASFTCAGQWCTSTSRVIVEEPVAEVVEARLAEEAAKMVVGNGLDSGTAMGPVCGTGQVETVTGYIRIGIEEGARLAAGGKRLEGEGFSNGCFITPAVFMGVTRDMTIAREEIFGPVLSVIRARDFEDAMAIADGTSFGLTSSIFTRDLERAFRFLERTEAGFTHVNLMTSYREPQHSFGGVKDSGYGLPEAGSTGVEFFTDHKVAYVKYRGGS